MNLDLVADTKIRIEIVASRLLQDRTFKKAVSEDDYKKVENFYNELRASDLKSDDKIEVFDIGHKLIFRKKAI